MTELMKLSSQAWLSDAATVRVVAALDTGPSTVRFVGGCVRDAIRGDAVKDVDLATVHPPEKIIELLEAANIKAVPTGLGHGTITAVADGKPYEVTTLRTDVETFGRHAEVAFTEDWRADAERRDFTMNAVYADPDGTLFDPVAGVADAQAGRVRFIGDADQRIQEDFLRILRFFRFSARFDGQDLDESGVDACARNKGGLKQLSGERVQTELLLLLASPSALPVLHVMKGSGVLDEVLPEVAALEAAGRLIDAEAQVNRPPDALLRLAAIVGDKPAALEIAKRLKFSNDMKHRLEAALDITEAPMASFDDSDIRRLLYKLGRQTSFDRILLSWARDADTSHGPAWQSVFDKVQTLDEPKFPLAGRDVIKLGVAPGTDVGTYLDHVERWWIENDFAPDRAALLNELKKRVG